MTSEPRSNATSELDAMLEESRKQFDALYGDADTRPSEKPTTASTPAPEPAAPATRPTAPVDETPAPNSAPASIQGSAAGVAFSIAPTPNNAAAFRATKKDTPG
jgi:hypothetical protein